jgi:hypothetical protein
MLHAGGPTPSRLPSLPGKNRSRVAGKWTVSLAKRAKRWYHVLFFQKGAMTVAAACACASFAASAGRADHGGLH